MHKNSFKNVSFTLCEQYEMCDICMKYLFLSSQPAAGVSPVHAEADREVPDLGKGSDGVAGEETL